MGNIDALGKWETVYINGWPVEIKFISRSSINSCLWLRRALYETQATTVTLKHGNLYLEKVVSCSGENTDYTYHKCLKVYHGNSGFYVVCKGIRCYCTISIPKFVRDMF